ncbi:MAG: hypothetical protein NTW87_21855 [Planctomycetota bacterium]|nr:hypothetical protein [Planctomycetota bacterium]
MIMPPGSEGTIREDGEHLCAACALASAPEPAAAAVAPAASRGISAYGIRPAKADAASAVSESRRVPARPPEVPAAPRRSSMQLMIASGLFAFGFLLFIIVLVSRSGSAPETAAVVPDGEKPAPAPADKASAPGPAPVTPPEPAAPVGGPRFLDPVVPRPATPESPATSPAMPVPPITKPAPGPDLVPKTAPVVTAPQPQEPPKPAAATAEQVQEISSGMKKAAELSAAWRYSAALAQLAALKEKYGAAAWWEANKEEWAKTERAVQQQLTEYSSEAEDALRQIAKATDLKPLDKLQAEWKAKAGGPDAGESGKWTRFEIVSMTAASGANFARQDDGSVLVSGNNPNTDRYTVVAKTYWAGITAFRLEAIPDNSLPNRGPGRSTGNGNFALSSFTVDCAPLDNAGRTQRVSFNKATCTYGQQDHTATGAMEGRGGWWDIFPEVGKLQAAVFGTTTPVGFENGTTLTFTLDFQTSHQQHNLGRFRLLLTNAKTPPDAQTLAWEVNPAGLPGDELGGKPARQVLAAIGKARTRVAEQQREKKLAELSPLLDTLEKQLKARSRTLDQLAKALDEIDGTLAQDPALAEKLLERVAGLRFDVTSAKEGELSIYKTLVKQLGTGAEVLYDFSTPEQFQAWTMDKPNNAGDVEHDPKSKTVRVKTVGGHNWDARDRRDTPVFRLPFYMKPEMWTFEANATLVNDANKKDKPDYGILVWDGSSAVVRFSIKEQGKDMHALVALSTPSKENLWLKPISLGAKPKDRVRLQMACDQQGTIMCTAVAPTGSTARVVNKEKIGFEPRYFGFFVRTNDGGENACVAFDSVRILGIPNKEKLKELADAARATALMVAKNALLRAKGVSANIAPLGKAASRCNWRVDGAGHEAPAAIDNNMDTYWDEEDWKPEYRLAVSFDQPHAVSAISIRGLKQHDFAPKDFDILADDKLIKEVRNAQYTDNLLRVEFPSTQLKTLELKITGFYGGSPTIRELGIYEP